MIRSRQEKTFSIFNYILLSILALSTLYPFWDVIRVSLSTAAEANQMGFKLWPEKITVEAYTYVLQNRFIWVGYKNTIIRILVGMSIQMTLMICVAYPLSKKYFPNRSFWTLIIVFTMFFKGGMIPDFLLIRAMNIDNTIWALVLPRAIDTFAMLIMRNNFMSLPDSLEESAKIDGAGDLKVLISIILPMSKPILMTVALWGIVWHWNAWFDCLIYIRDSNKYVLQAILRKIIIDSAPQFSEIAGGVDISTIDTNTSQTTIKCATIIVSTIPIVAIYPFIQKYFIKGMMVGALKG